MMIFYYLCDGVNMAARAWFVLKIVDGLFEPKWVKRKMRIGWAVVMVFAALNQVLNAYFFRALFSNGLLIVVILGMTAVSILLYECSIGNVLWFNMLFWIGIALVDFFIQTCVYLILDAMGGQRDILLSITMERAIYLVIYTAVIIFIGIKLRRWLVTKRQEALKYQKQGIVLGFLLLPILIYFQRIYLQQASERLLNQWWIFWLGLAIIILVFWLNTIRQKTEEEKRVQQLEIKMLDENYQSLLQVYSEKSVLIHDMKNHLRIILEMIEEKQIEKCQDYLLQITGEIQKKESLSWTNHKILDMVFNMKFQEARKAGIKVKCLSDDLSELELTTAEICSFFTNLLDNAIEASMQCPEGERQIRIVCRKQGRMLVVSFSNSMKENGEQQRKRMLETTKKDKSMHGFGMLSIENVIRGRDGYINIDISKNKFKIIAYLNGFLN